MEMDDVHVHIGMHLIFQLLLSELYIMLHKSSFTLRNVLIKQNLSGRLWTHLNGLYYGITFYAMNLILSASFH